MQAHFRFPAKMAPSSSGPGYLVLIQKIAGSNPAGVTILTIKHKYDKIIITS